jgi:DNA helicase-2/ATP-dependent DNA helicase PcrA
MSSALEQTDIDKLEVAFNADVTEYKYREERRLAYVAVTRAKKSLMLSASVYKGTNKSAVKASPYLTELAGSGEPSLKVIGGTGDPESPLPALAKLEVNPDSEVEFSLEWPMDPLGPNHRVALEKARDLVDESPAKLDASKVEKEINLLLDDLAESVARASQAKLPVRIPASRFKEFLLETEEVAELYRRPVPREPFSATMAGTLFHTWVEERFQVFSPKEELDIKVEAVDDGNPQLNIEELKAIFEKSRFASMEPADIECEIQVTIKSNTFICKIDAVFKTEDGFEIVDWKTGIAPTTPEDIAEKALQLALYRMAYAKFHGIEPDKIEVCLYYVNDNLEIKPELVKTEDELLAMWQGVLDKVTD